MELHVTRPPVEEIPPDGDMRSPEGSSAKYNTENGYARVLRTGASGWEMIEAPWHDPFVHMAQEAVDWVDGKIDDPISAGAKGRATMEVLMAIYESGPQAPADRPAAEDASKPAAVDGRVRASSPWSGPARTRRAPALCAAKRCSGSAIG